MLNKLDYNIRSYSDITNLNDSSVSSPRYNKINATDSYISYKRNNA